MAPLEADLESRQRHAPEQLVHVAEFGLIGAQKLATRRHVIEEIGQFDPRATRPGCRLEFPRLHALGSQLPAMLLAGKTVIIRAELHSPDCQYGDQDSPRLYAVYTK